MAKKIELLHTTYDESGNIESQEVVHPLTSPDCIIMENGKTLDEVMGDGIATPTLTHEGTSFKVGVGDSNIEVVDGDVAGMTLKGQSYQNILPKPTTLIMETDEQEFKINDKIDSNIIIDDNIAEIATVKGKTIVNAVQEESASEYTVLGKDLSGQSIVHVKEMSALEGNTLVNVDTVTSSTQFVYSSIDGVDKDGFIQITANGQYRNAYTPFNNQVKPSTKYLIYLEIKENTLNGQFSICSSHSESHPSVWVTTVGNINQKVTGVFKYVATTINDFTNTVTCQRNFVRNDATTGKIVYRTMVIEYQEGMENWDIPYFEGTKTFENNIKGVTLQGQTLVNTIQEPCKDDYVVLGADDGIEISAETGGHGTIENTIQGGINGTVLEGQTLVDLMIPGGTPIIQMSGEYTYSVISKTREYIALEVNTASSNSWGYFHMPINLAMLKPMTKYLVKGDLHNVRSFKIASGDSSIQISNIAYINETNYVILQTSETLSTNSDVKLFIDIIRDVGNVCSIKNLIMVEYQDGMENWDIPYFEGMKSVQMPVLKTTGKNLFDVDYVVTNMNLMSIERVENGVKLKANESQLYRNAYSRGFKVESGKYYNITYTVVNENPNNVANVTLKNMVGGDFPGFRDCAITGSGTATRTFLAENSGYVRPQLYAAMTTDNGDYYVTYTNVMISEVSSSNDVNVEHEPYQSSTVSINDYVLNSTQFEQGTFSESSPTGTPYRQTLPTGYMDIRLRSKSLFKVSGNAIRGTLNKGYGIFFGFFKDGKYIAKYSSWMDSTSFSVDVPYECNEFCIVLRKNISDTINVSEYDLIGLTLEQVVELRGIGDVKDELDLQTGKLTQRVGEVVLDGSNDENWTLNNTANTTTNRFIITIPKSKVTNDEQGKQSYLCDKLQKGLWSDERTIGITIIDTAVFLYNKDIDYSINALRNWLQTNPITIQYPLATESVKTIDLQVTDQDGNTIPHIQTQPTVTHITASSDYLIPTVTIDNNLSYDTIIKPSTLYTVRFKHNTVNADNPLAVDLGGTTQVVTSTEFTITTPSTLTHNQLVFSGKNNVVSEVQVIEGNVVGTQYPFFEGMNDVQITDMIRNVNLFDMNDTVSGYLGGTGTEIKVPDHGNLTSNYIKVKPNTTYVYNHGGFVSNFADYWTGMYFYQDDKGTESNLYTNGSFNRFVHTGQGRKYSNFKFTTPADCEYIRIGSRGLSYDGAWATLYQLDNFDDSKFIARSKNIWQWGDFLDVGIAEITVDLEPGEYWFSCNSSIAYDFRPVIVFFDENLSQITYGFADQPTHYILPTKAKMIYIYSNGYSYQDSKTNLTSFTNIMLTKEPHTKNDYEPYKGVVEVQQDVDIIPLTSDMFEQNGFNLDNYNATGFTIQQLNLWITPRRIKSKTMIKVKPNAKYIYNDSVIGYALFFDKNGLYVGRDNTYNSITTTHDTQYVAMCLQYPQDLTTDTIISPSDLDSMNLILQEVPQEIALRGIGDVKDELDLTRGEYIQRIGEVVLDGSENWELLDWLPSGLTIFRTSISNIRLYEHVHTDKTIPNIISNSLKTINYNDMYLSGSKIQNGITTIYSSTLQSGAIFISHEDIKDINLLKEYLGINPITVQYQLATPIIHKVNLTNTKVIQSYSTETHYETITPSDSLIPNITIPSTLNYDVAIKPYTEYTIRANTSDNLTVNLGGATGTLSNGKVTLTTPATLTHNEVKFSGTGKVKELMVVEGNEIKDNVSFFNGMKDVKMGGIKLVNIARGATCNNLVTANTNKTHFTYTSDGTNWGDVLFDKSLLKQNTLYTIYINVISSNSDNANPLKISMGDDLNTWLNVSSTGLFKQTFTTNDNIGNLFGINFRPCTSGQKVVIENPMIIEGDWTHLDEIPYIESEMIIEQPIIRSQGKNLLDPTTMQAQSYNGNTVTKIARGFNIKTSEQSKGWNENVLFYIDVEPYTEYTYSFIKNVITDPYANKIEQGGTAQWREGYCFIRGVQTNDVRMEGSSPNGVRKYMPFNSGNNTKLYIYHNAVTDTGYGVGEFELLDFQLEKGRSTTTRYEPYKHQTLYSNRVIGYEEGVHYGYGDGIKYTNANYNSVMADVEGLSIAYVTNGSSNFTFWNRDGVYISGKGQLDTALSLTDKNGFITVPTNAKYMKFASSCGTGANTDYTKATVTGELPLRSLPNGVCDTLNLVTGEYVQRVGEVVLDGSQTWSRTATVQSDKYRVYIRLNDIKSVTDNNIKNILMCDKYVNVTADNTYNLWKGVSLEKNHGGGSALIIYDEQFSTNTNNIEFQQYLSQNPITVQYELATPIVRKLGFTTKGNYRQANLATDCEWGASPTTANNTFTTRYRTKSASSLPIVYNTHLFSNDFPIRYFNVDGHKDYEYISNMEYGQYVNVRRDKLEADTPEAFSKWLQHNPIEVGYIAWQQSSESYSNIHKPIFFNNVNVQFLPYNLDIQPQLTYQARTRNSYVLDMAKSNTLYTVKAFSNPHNFYIDGKSFGKGTNGCITTPTLTNKLLVTGSSDVKELMIIEGDVTGKNLPYFKGILSSYHDVDEIEVYSVNKNLFDMSKVKPFEGRGTYWWNTIVKENEVISVRIGDINNGQFGAYVKLNVRPNSVYTLYIEMEKDGEPYNGQIYGYENDDLWGNGTFTGYANTPYHIRTSQNAKYITIGFNYGKDFPIGTTLVSKNMRLYLGEESPVYIPHAHSTTLIEMPTRLETVKVVRPVMENGSINSGTGANYAEGDSLVKNVRTKDYLPVQPGEIIKFYNNGQGRAVNMNYYDINKQFVKYEFYDGTSTRPTVPNDCYFVRMYCGKSACSDITLTRQAYKPIQLNSLPNGVYDEIIMKPNSNKAQLIQRVGKVVLDGIYYPLSASAGEVKGDDISCTYSVLNNVAGGICQSDKLLNVSYSQGYKNIECIMLGTNTIIASILKTRAYNAGEYAKENPITVYYELTTPIIHEIQLKGYPHVYENGTVTLNTDIPHKTLVSYNVNQEQLISTQNETIIRHDQQIDDLYYYIEMYLEEIYQMELFRMKLELSL